MARRILVVPVNHGAGVTAACLGLAHALHERHVAVGYVKPFAGEDDASTALIRQGTTLRPPEPIPLDALADRSVGGRVTGVMTEVVQLVQDLDTTTKVLVLEGVADNAEQVHADRLNSAVARALDAEVLLVAAVHDLTPERLARQVAAADESFRTRSDSRVVGVLLNRVPAGTDPEPYVQALAAAGFTCAGAVEHHPELAQARVGDIAHQLRLEVIAGRDLGRRIQDTVIAAMNMPGFIPWLTDGALVVTPGDRHDVLMAAALAEASGTRLAGVLLTVGLRPDPNLLGLVTPALGDLPILASEGRTFDVVSQIIGLSGDIPMDDTDRARHVMDVVADGYDDDFLKALPQPARIQRRTAPQVEQHFRDLLSRGHLRLVVTDGDDPRVLAAVLWMTAAYPGVHLSLVADPAAVDAALAEMGEALPVGIAVHDPAETHSDVAVLAAALRRELAEADVVFEAGHPVPYGLALLRAGAADGLVGGLRDERSVFLESVARTVPRSDGVMVLSSSQMAALSEDVVFLADTMLNEHPGAVQLACIAARTAHTAELAGLEPAIGFVAPSRLSGLHDEAIEAIAGARAMLAERRPDLPTEGPAPLTELTGRPRTQPQPTVLVFPDVAAAVASAKAIHQAGATRIHPPVLQGFSRAVNMLPMDATVDTVLDTLVATAIQAIDLR